MGRRRRRGSILHVDFICTTVAARDMLRTLLDAMLLLLHHDFSRVELDKHGAVCFKLLHRNGQSKIVQEEELQLQVIELCKGKTSDLCHQN